MTRRGASLGWRYRLRLLGGLATLGVWAPWRAPHRVRPYVFWRWLG